MAMCSVVQSRAWVHEEKAFSIIVKDNGGKNKEDKQVTVYCVSEDTTAGSEAESESNFQLLGFLKGKPITRRCTEVPD